MRISTAGQRVSKWGEGPVFWQGKLWYVDIEGHEVVSYDPKDQSEQVWPVGQRVGLVVPREKGGLMCAGDCGFFTLDPETGKTEAVADPEPDLLTNRFNDGKCSPDGYLFAGTISLTKDPGAASLYRLAPSGEVSKVLGDLTNSNGIAWSLDGEIMYHIDTPRRSIFAYRYQAGEVGDGRMLIDTGDIDASPDGMTIDSEGRLWVAFCHGACVIAYDPASGGEVERIQLPCLETTAPCFGGENLNDLYVTTGIHSRVKEELGGRLLKIEELNVRGASAFAFAG